MSDEQLIRRGDVLKAVQYHVTDDDDRNTLSHAIDALPPAKQEHVAISNARGVGVQERVQHKKRGSTYRVVGRGKVQTDTPLTDYAEVVVYQCEADGAVWVRPVSEFEDGRFAALAPTDAAQESKDGK